MRSRLFFTPQKHPLSSLNSTLKLPFKLLCAYRVTASKAVRVERDQNLIELNPVTKSLTTLTVGLQTFKDFEKHFKTSIDFNAVLKNLFISIHSPRIFPGFSSQSETEK